MFESKKQLVGYRIAYGPLEAKSDMKKAAKRLKMSFPGHKFDVQRVGKEFWVMCYDADEQQHDKMLRSIVAWYEHNGMKCSVVDGTKRLFPPRASNGTFDVPDEPPEDIRKGPYVILIWLDNEEQSSYEKFCETWRDVQTSVAEVNSFEGLKTATIKIGVVMVNKAQTN